jgi:hypothetical protein
MKNEEKYYYADFTRQNYREIIRLAKRNYLFRTYDNFQQNEKFILWRHDVDYTMHSARKLAYIESEEGVISTFFLHLHNEYYNLLEKEISDCVYEIIGLGHRIGLHFDTEYYHLESPNQLEKPLLREKHILQDFFGQDINVFSFHNPSKAFLEWGNWECAGLVNTYSSYFWKNVEYCSDSNGYWRYKRLPDLLNKADAPCLQVLTHPVWWQDEVSSPRQRIQRCIDGRAEKNSIQYDKLLEYLGHRNIGKEEM